MEKKIFILTWVSYTSEDDYLYSDVKVFTDEKEARKQYDNDCEKAYEECKWGSQSDPKYERDEYCSHDVDEERSGDSYTVSSDAYDGYKVQVKLVEKEVEL